MECAICFEKFYTPKTKEELEQIYQKFVKNKDDYKEFLRFKNLIITPKNNTTHTCSIPNCQCLICGDCWIKITHKDNEPPGIYEKFTCPYCRNIDWKDYMENVLQELQDKVLGEEESNKLLIEKILSSRTAF